MPTVARTLGTITIVCSLVALFGAITARDLWPVFVGAGMGGLVTGVFLHLTAEIVEVLRDVRKSLHASRPGKAVKAEAASTSEASAPDAVVEDKNDPPQSVVSVLAAIAGLFIAMFLIGLAMMQASGGMDRPPY